MPRTLNAVLFLRDYATGINRQFQANLPALNF
jgi:hypothetical protein